MAGHLNHYWKSVSTHSRPKAAGDGEIITGRLSEVSTHSRPKAAGAACTSFFSVVMVSTHSRPKAAGRRERVVATRRSCFNTQPPEGGWVF